ncbi:MAG: hypothetical protein RL637_770 [Pseudomonadota bacterium]|jgi:probable H4MPT-linked C1 transfer pathway protein
MNPLIVGWDIGGAHVKAAILNYQTYTADIYQFPCPLWQGLNHLITAIQNILSSYHHYSLIHFVTMTGELVDLFPNRMEGVKQIIAVLQAELKQNTWCYAAEFGFISINQIQSQHYLAIASMNWLASANWIAQHIDNGLFIDIGSTTTDILLINQRKVEYIGKTDAQRLQSQELVYSGIGRTPIMAVSQQVFWQGQIHYLMAEYFATMADVYRLTGELNPCHDQAETADGGDKTKIASACRLARMLGKDFNHHEYDQWLIIAKQLKYQQKNAIQQACLRQLSRFPNHSCLIGAGIGQFLVAQIAKELEFEYLSINQLISFQSLSNTLTIADIFPAFAVADLAYHSSFDK